MKLEEMIASLKEIEKENDQLMIKKVNDSVDLSSVAINGYQLLKLLLSEIKRDHLCGGLELDIDFEKVLGIDDSDYIYLYEDTKKEFINMMMNEIKKVPTKTVFSYLFSNHAFMEKDRLRAITSGGVIIQNKEVETAIANFFSLCQVCLEDYFRMGPQEEFLKNYTSLILSLITCNETVFSKVDIMDFLREFSYFKESDIDETIQSIFFNWYQSNNYTFLHETTDNLYFFIVMQWDFMLTKEQRETASKNLHSIVNNKYDCFILNNKEKYPEFNSIDFYETQFIYECEKLLEWEKKGRK